MADTKKTPKTHQKCHPEPENSPSRRALKSFFSCKYHRDAEEKKNKKCKKLRCNGSLCHLKDTSSALNQKPRASLREINGDNSTDGVAVPKSKAYLSSNSSSTLATVASASSSVSSSVGGSFRVMHLRRLSGCYECHMVVDPINGFLRESSLRSTVCTCPDCGEIFVKAESLELHQSVRHAVSELGPEDTSRNIVEIIFQSSWLKKQTPVCKIDRILKIHNTKKTISSFEAYRDSIKNNASEISAKKHPRCIADGNELLRFHCTTFRCSLGLDGSSNLCDSIPSCKACGIIRHGVKTDDCGRIQTLATSGRAHDSVKVLMEGEKRAMLVCRVIAGRVKKNQESTEEFDSVAGVSGVYSNLDELFVFDPKAILPCFVVIYRDF
ncbi:uncharacterized protein A4U43_C04F3700 [Asparagus officinalis]|uniref:C2H2-type domain-containing protein n=1 Tax=Asparagus officinalis TaxID=4686 RepID=A0A5P1F2R5_ASPOF|nr:uncharacterized protein LOC109836544 [Asparagus officinalis]ONK71001.1 uncharacterized protein A4U43_C04F3700 [Asparagus officinalis]